MISRTGFHRPANKVSAYRSRMQHAQWAALMLPLPDAGNTVAAARTPEKADGIKGLPLLAMEEVSSSAYLHHVQFVLKAS